MSFFICGFHALLLLICISTTFCIFYVDWRSAETIYSLNLKPLENTVWFFMISTVYGEFFVISGIINGMRYLEDILIKKVFYLVLGKTPTLFRSKDITLPLKSQKIVSPVFAGSSDESALEIGWDNNSPSPTTALRSG